MSGMAARQTTAQKQSTQFVTDGPSRSQYNLVAHLMQQLTIFLFPLYISISAHQGLRRLLDNKKSTVVKYSTAPIARITHPEASKQSFLFSYDRPSLYLSFPS